MNKRIINILLTVVFINFGLAQIEAQTCATAPIGLVANYAAENNALDARSRDNGTIQNGVTYTTGKVGQSFNLAGSNGDRVLIGNPANLQLQEFTIEAWIKRSSSSVVTNSPNPADPSGVLFAYGQGGYAFLINQNTNKLGFSHTQFSQVLSPTLTITDTNWHHVAFTKSGGQVIFYLDGVADAPVAYNPTFSFTTNAAIGARGDGVTDQVFFGAIDELGIYNRALTTTEIQSIFNSGIVGKCKPIATYAPDNQVLWLAGDGDALDSSGYGNNGTLQSGAAFSSGKVGQAFKFDGTSLSQINIPDSQSLRPVTAVTVEGWLNPSSSQLGFQGVVFKGNTGSAGGQPYSLFVSGATHNLVVRVGNDSNFQAFGSVGGIPADVYSHVAFTYDGTNVRIYINGVLDSTQASTIGTLAQADTNPLRIGGLGGGFTFTGSADEIGIYNRALSDSEVQSISNAGLGGKYKVQSTVPANLVAWYGGDGNTNDLQGGNNGILENGAAYGNGKVGQGFQFDGTDDQVTIPHNANQNVGTNLTLEAWINPSALPHGGTIIQKRTSGNIGGYLLEPTQTSGGAAPNGLQFVIMIGGVYQTLNPANILTANTWQHVAATYDGAFMRIYVNGVEVGNRPQTGAIDASTAPVIIGRNAVNLSAAFQGGIDEPAIYNRALSASEIRDQFYAGNGGKYKGAVNPTVSNATKTGEATVTFGSVSTAGAVHLSPLNSASLLTLPMGTNTGLNFDVSTNATYTNPTVCFNVSSIPSAQFSNLRIYHLESGIWQNRTAGVNSYPNLCTSGLTSLSPFAIASVAPTAANATISGRVRDGKNGLSNVVVRISGGNLTQPISVKTNNFGFYRFANLPVGATYVVSVYAKKYYFPQSTRAVNLLDEITEFDFEAESENCFICRF